MSHRILLIDDEDDILEFIRYNLTKAGYEVYTARNGAEGLQQAAAHRPHLILLDVMMPTMDGIETCRELRELGDFVFGIGGVVTFKKSRLAEVVRDMELREIVLETDCPYLTPAPHRGERNESAYVRYVCEKVAEIKGLTPAEVAAATAENAKRIFKGI